MFVRASMAGCINHSDLVMVIPVWELSIVVACKQVAALYSEHYRQVPLGGAGCLDRWLPYTVSTIDRSHWEGLAV